MSIAIITRYHGPTETRGARITASSYNRTRITVSWDDALDVEGNHDYAAQALAKRRGWKGRVSRASHPDGTGNIYIIEQE